MRQARLPHRAERAPRKPTGKNRPVCAGWPRAAQARFPCAGCKGPVSGMRLNAHGVLFRPQSWRIICSATRKWAAPPSRVLPSLAACCGRPASPVAGGKGFLPGQAAAPVACASPPQGLLPVKPIGSRIILPHAVLHCCLTAVEHFSFCLPCPSPRLSRSTNSFPLRPGIFRASGRLFRPHWLCPWFSTVKKTMNTRINTISIHKSDKRKKKQFTTKLQQTKEPDVTTYTKEIQSYGKMALEKECLFPC